MAYLLKTDCAWHHGDPVGPGKGCPYKPQHQSGIGTNKDPYVYWVGSIDEDVVSDAQFHASTDLARKEAIDTGFPTVVIRGPSHSTVLRKDGNGMTIRNPNTGELETDPADDHFTLFLGQSLDNLQIHGHRYLKVDKTGVPTGFMSAEDRVIVKKGQDPAGYEYWGMAGSCGYEYVERPDPTSVPRNRNLPAYHPRNRSLYDRVIGPYGPGRQGSRSSSIGGPSRIRKLDRYRNERRPSHYPTRRRTAFNAEHYPRR